MTERTTRRRPMTAPADNDVMRAQLAAINCPKGTVEANLDTHLRLLDTAHDQKLSGALSYRHIITPGPATAIPQEGR